MRPLRDARTWLAALLFWLGLLWWLSSRPGVPGPELLPHLDKLAHFGYFAGGAFLFAGWQARKRGLATVGPGLVAVTVIFGSLVGVIDEWHQLSTPGRSGGDLWDWAADTVGSLAGALALKAAHPRLR